MCGITAHVIESELENHRGSGDAPRGHKLSGHGAQGYGAQGYGPRGFRASGKAKGRREYLFALLKLAAKTANQSAYLAATT